MSEQENDGWAERLRAEARRWLDENWDPSLDVATWWSRVAEAGWNGKHFPADKGGGGLPSQAAGIVREEFTKYGALAPPGGLGMLMAAPTILTHGTPEQIERFVPPILSGQIAWCQLFSEPGAGSDLAGLTTRAVRDGDKFIINGQKVWSSRARASDYGMLLARTNFDAAQARGNLLVRVLPRPARRRRPPAARDDRAGHCSTRCSSTMPRCPPKTSSAARVMAGPSRRRRCCSSASVSARAGLSDALRTPVPRAAS